MPPRAPAVTGKVLREHYIREATDAGLALDDADESLIARLAAATDAARQVEAELARSGAVLISETGTPRRNPLVADLRALSETIARLTVLLDRRIADTTGTGPADRGGTRPFQTRGSYDKAKTGTDAAPAVRRPARTRPRKRT